MARSPEIIVHIDGGSRGNPGPAAYGVVVDSADGSRLAAFSRYLGKATNNVAEYEGLLAALEHALANHHSRLRVLTDSELLALQIKRVYKVKSPGLKPLHDRALGLIARLESFSIQHVPREANRQADRLANQALDEAAGGVDTSASHPAPAAQAQGQGSLALADAPDRTPESAPPLRASATFRQGRLAPHFQLPLFEGEVVDLVIYRKE